MLVVAMELFLAIAFQTPLIMNAMPKDENLLGIFLRSFR
jgi:hypothetical protein